MLITTVISSPIVTSSTLTSAISLMSEVGLPKGVLFASIELLLLVVAKEIISASKKGDCEINASLNIAINPLLITFVLIVVYKITEII